MTENNNRFAIPSWVIWWTALAALAFFVYLVRAVLPPFVVGAALAFMFSPVVDSIQARWRFPRGAAIAALYLVGLVPLTIALVIFGPRLLDETRSLIDRTPRILEQLILQFLGAGPYNIFGSPMDSRQLVTAFMDIIRGSLGTPASAIRFIASAAELTLNAFLSLVISIYLLADSANVSRALVSVFPRDRRAEVDSVGVEIHLTLARYLRRELFLVVLVSVVTFLGLELFFRLHYALAVAVLTGFVEIIPFFGPVVAATVAALIALSQSGTQVMVGVIVFYIVLRQVEDQIVMPVVLGRAVELHPLVVIFAVLAGGALFGVLGTLAAVPVAAAIKVILNYWPKRASPQKEVAE